MTIDEFKEHVRILKVLADDPHPSLMTWNEIVGKAIEDLYADYSGKKEKQVAQVQDRR